MSSGTNNIHQNSNLVVKNGVFLFFRLLLVLFLGFFATRLSLQALGDEKFGIYNIVGGIIAIFAIVSMPIRDSIQRYLNVELVKKEISPASIFHTSENLVFLMIIIISILYESIGLYFINNVINYPINEKDAVHIIFQISVITNIFGFATLPFTALLFSKENMGVPAICEICGAVIKIVLLYMIKSFPINTLVSYSLIFLLINLGQYSFYQFYCRNRYKECFTKSPIDRGLRNNMLSFSGWSFVEAAAGIALTYLSNVFINIFGGVLYNTAYGISKQLQNAVVSFSSNVLKASDPQIISNTVTNNYRYRDQLVITTAKISLIVTSYAFIVFHFEGGSLLDLWLKDTPKYAVEFCELAILATVFTSVILPFRTTIMATGHIKNYFMTYGVVSLLSMIAMYFSLKLGYPIISVMYIIALSNVIMLFFSIYFSRKQALIGLRFTITNLFLTSIPIAFSFLCYYLCKMHIEGRLLSTICAILISFIILVSLGYWIALSSIERQKIKQFVKILINKILH